ncbi:MAG: IS5 family transposase [Candidatus Peregrinibacteria bacterium]|nr:IS5 family transposase [Candidatus Peregrinibacteria bacterium]
MIQYISGSQLSIEEFETPFNNSLLADNRWVMLSKVVNWDKFASLYISKMNLGFGRPGVSPRIVLGALIIKHKENLGDRDVIATIQENPYMQYFVGLSGFSTKPVFDPSLFVEIRKRIGADDFDTLTVDLIQSISEKEDIKHNKKHKKEDESPKNKGKMQADATVADQMIAYPTDSNLLNISRKKSEEVIDKLYELSGKDGVKPKTYRNKIDKIFLSYSKKKSKPKKAHRKMNHLLLEAVNRNIKRVNKYLDNFKTFPLTFKEQQVLWIITEVYRQQKEMFEAKKHSCSDRIVSIFQPHVRPIPRGKARARVEFGSKLGVSLDDGFARIDTFSWDAYSEGKDLIKQIKNYKELHGHYPEVVQVDKAYSTNENRKWLKERGIRITAPPLGRKPKIQENAYQKRKKKKEAAERNHIEGKFGQGKNGYRLNQVRARLKSTSESWVACIFFVMNLINYQKKVVFCAFFKLRSPVVNYWSIIIKAIENEIYKNKVILFNM